MVFAVVKSMQMVSICVWHTYAYNMHDHEHVSLSFAPGS